jgi:cell division septation protein DedD
MEQGAVRNLEQIQETDSETRTPRAVTIALVVLCGACVTFGVVALKGRKTPPEATKTDPLGALVASQKGALGTKATDLTPKDVTFPAILSDDQSPTTALAAVKGGPKPTGTTPPPPSVVAPAAGPPPPTDRLPVIPLPAQAVLEATPIVTRPRDTLTRAATDQAQITAPANPSAPSGHEGGYQLQVSSFRSQTEAQEFSDQLRARGHKSYVLEAHVPGRGTWYRVRVGPFPSQQAAAAYRSSFETREHVVPFLVLPDKDKR